MKPARNTASFIFGYIIMALVAAFIFVMSNQPAAPPASAADVADPIGYGGL